jgi:hypothetical protein
MISAIKSSLGKMPLAASSRESRYRLITAVSLTSFRRVPRAGDQPSSACIWRLPFGVWRALPAITETEKKRGVD